MDMTAVFADPRRRNLAILAGAALVSVLLAILALWHQASFGQGGTAPTEFLPGFARDVRNAARIHIASGDTQFDVVFVPEKGWVVPERDNYPASFDLVQRTLVGLAALQTVEPKTARPDWLHYLGLETPPLGPGIAIGVSDDKGREMASIITGKTEDIGDSTGATGLFVRRAGENQSWLVRSVLDPRASLTDWLDKKVLSVDRARIQEVDVDPAGSPSFIVHRAVPSDPDFVLSPVPAGKSVTDPTIPDGVAAVLTDFGFDDVRPSRELDFANPTTTARVVTKTFDGLEVTANVLKQGNDYWATLTAQPLDAGRPDAGKEAAAINARAIGWAFKLPAFKGQLFMTTLDSLLKAPPAPPPQAPMPGGMPTP